MAIFSAARSRSSLHSPSKIIRLSKMNASTIPNPTSSTLISPSAAKSLLLKQFDPDKSLSIISSIRNPSSSPASSRFAVDLAVRRLAASRRFSDIQSLLESRKSLPAASQEPFLCTLIISYGSARMLHQAISTFNQIPILCSSPPSTLSFNALLTAALRANKHRRVPKLFSELSENLSISPDSVSYGVLVKALCLSGKSGKALEIVKEMEGKGLKVSAFVYTTLLDSLWKKGEAEKAEVLWDEMVKKGLCNEPKVRKFIR